MPLNRWAQLVVILAMFCNKCTLVSALDNSEIVASIDGQPVTYKMLLKGNELDIHEAEMNLHQVQLNKLKQMLISQLINKDPRSKGLGEQQFVERYIVKPLNLTQADIDAFIVEKKILPQNIDSELKQKIHQYLKSQHIAEQMEKWFAEQSKKYNIRIDLTEPPEPRFDVSVGDAPFIGGENAKVTIIEFSDFECPYCVKASNVVRELNRIYGDKIKIAYKHFPLSFHPNAQKAAEAGICASQQGNEYFWQLHDRMFADFKNLSQGMIKDMAKLTALDYPQFAECLTSGRVAAKVTNDVREGMAVGVTSTPAFFVNGRLIRGAQPLEVFVKKIDEELAK